MNGELTLSEAFLRGAPAPCLHGLRGIPELQGILEGLIERARQTHPTLPFQPEDFLRYVAARLPTKGDMGTALDCVRAEELLLAYACVQGNHHALASLDRQVFSQVPSWFPGQDSAVVAEIGQRLRQRLLMAAPPSVPKLATFTGRGTLTRWARAIATRLLADIQQERSNPVPLTDITPENDALVRCDPELDLIRGRYAEPFRLAFQEAMAALTPRERNLLRLHHLDNLSVDSVGTMYQTSRSTAARWIAKARQHLLERTRAALSTRLALAPEELDSLMAMLPSHLDVSIHRLLQP